MLKHFYQRIQVKKSDPRQPPVLLVAFGDSVTQGCMECGVIDHAHVFHHQLKQMLESAHPQTTFSVLNSGVEGDSASGAIGRLYRDVIRHAPDLVFVGFCLNDAMSGIQGIEEYSRSMTAILDRITSESDAGIILLTPNFMASKATHRIHAKHLQYAKDMLACQNEGVLAAYVRELRRIAVSRNHPVADVYAEWEQLAANGVDTTPLLCNGLNHPDVSGQNLIAKTIWEVIQKADNS
ncbi:MAG: GDSL-type esterase/lipase family protein [Chloroflexota bacterium]